VLGDRGQVGQATIGNGQARAPRLLLIDDHAVLNEAFAQALKLAGFDQVLAANPARHDDEALVRLAARHRPDVVVLDLLFGNGRTGLSLIAALRALPAEILVLTGACTKELYAAAMTLGAAGVIDKALGFAAVIERIDAVAAHVPVTDEPDELDRDVAALRRLSPREREVLAGLLLGRSAKQIACELGIGIPTVRSQIRSMFEKLGVNNQRAAIVLALGAGWDPRAMR
jgi:DNA-binding NarL/FixJ family response regulator